ncbi:hypothetical protein I5L01_08115 [Erythrobacter sp. YJ-T3-07]|uniref:hypothetical protein n=1 Tax=Erythrobacter sp. YJ-T3-07 TaxID=2793063 RepID=UPI0018D4CEB0|nr:hypothetical protein [Erythrobacter sp. YJ-T3-07]MBH1944200.1 hypothetical protein [Erythrobacter sp. YJ-T3-07]
MSLIGCPHKFGRHVARAVAFLKFDAIIFQFERGGQPSAGPCAWPGTRSRLIDHPETDYIALDPAIISERLAVGGPRITRADDIFALAGDIYAINGTRAAKRHTRFTDPKKVRFA